MCVFDQPSAPAPAPVAQQVQEPVQTMQSPEKQKQATTGTVRAASSGRKQLRSLDIPTDGSGSGLAVPM